ncbi:hypothetical protein [Streptomyces sp. NBC_00046]|uniref:hypothetical protein n=1 Tax=unclassified Streptomyces TaxID=2593676 RepID=UPI00325175C8
MLITNVRPWDGEPCDIEIENGTITALTPHDPDRAAADGTVAGRGRLALPSFSDVHCHLDSPASGCPSARTRAPPASGP